MRGGSGGRVGAYLQEELHREKGVMNGKKEGKRTMGRPHIAYVDALRKWAGSQMMTYCEKPSYPWSKTLVKSQASTQRKWTKSIDKQDNYYII